MKTTEWQVWARPLGRDEPRFFGAYALERWQWAMKLAAFLRDKGHLDVEVVEAEVEYGPDDD